MVGFTIPGFFDQLSGGIYYLNVDGSINQFVFIVLSRF